MGYASGAMRLGCGKLSPRTKPGAGVVGGLGEGESVGERCKEDEQREGDTGDGKKDLPLFIGLIHEVGEEEDCPDQRGEIVVQKHDARDANEWEHVHEPSTDEDCENGINAAQSACDNIRESNDKRGG